MNEQEKETMEHEILLAGCSYSKKVQADELTAQIQHLSKSNQLLLQKTPCVQVCFVCLLVDFRPTREFFTHMETPPLPTKGCDFLAYTRLLWSLNSKGCCRTYSTS